MSQPASEDRCHLGFLRVVPTETGFLGGLLVTNHLGRPLEFQCTTPVRPNRTQEILYGQTLQPFLFSELIGKTLCERISVKPQLLIVAQPELLDLRLLVKTPVACLLSSEDARDLPDQTLCEIGRQQARVHPDFLDDEDFVRSVQSRIANDADFIEPLDRVRDALLETVRTGAAA